VVYFWQKGKTEKSTVKGGKMLRFSRLLLLAGVFFTISVLTYLLHYFIFKDTHHIFIYMVGDLAFLPLEVFLVVVVIERLLESHEKTTIRKKLNMIIGAFFSEVGHELFRRFNAALDNKEVVREQLAIDQSWTQADFKQAAVTISTTEEKLDLGKIDLEKLRTFLIEKRSFLVTLLENPHLLEYEEFTDLLWATFHLAEELEARPSLEGLPAADFNHIAGDTLRVYQHLTVQWISYMEHLKSKYPFLFSFVTRTNPFLENPSPTVV